MDNPYRHIQRFTTQCNVVRQEGVLDDWFKWNLFPYSLAVKAIKWYSFTSFEVEGNWNQLIKKFCAKFFPIRKIQHIRMQVINLSTEKKRGLIKRRIYSTS
jgi:hypothetical protein